MSKKYIEPEQIVKDWDVSLATAYKLIRKLNKEIKERYPSAIVVAGKVNKKWYDQACLDGFQKSVNG